MIKKTLVLGASPNPERYGFKATAMLREYKHPVIPFGLKAGEVEGLQIIKELPTDNDFDTVTLYVGPENQKSYYEYVISLHPKRVVFNPGTENPEFEKLLADNDIQVLEACTLVLLRTGQY